MVQDREFSLLHAGGKLFQQYVVDVYCRAEAQRMKYIRDHQHDLRVDSYKGLMDFVAGVDSVNGAHCAGKPVVLPSSYPGCPRNMQQLYMDAMAIVARFGKPDRFITMTANPKCAKAKRICSRGRWRKIVLIWSRAFSK